MPKILNQNSNSHKGVWLWAKSINHFGNFGRHFPCATSAKIHAAMYARVPQAMAQFCSKNRKIVPYHGANPNTRNSARLRSPSPIMAPDVILFCLPKVFLVLVCARLAKVRAINSYYCIFVE